MLSSFNFVSGNSGRFLTEDRWNIDGIYFNPAPNVVPSNQTPSETKFLQQLKLNLIILTMQ